EQVNRAIMQMDGVTQSNAAQVEELSGTSQSLAAQAELMQDLVTHFSLKNEPAADFAANKSVGEKMKSARTESSTTETSVMRETERPATSAKAKNVQYLKPRVAGQKTGAAGGDWTEF
ncbi:MAG: hypothetical protein ACYDBW_08745, partial [Sulfuricaulis sp.]